MMPDLARYAGTVLGAYAVTLALIALIVAVSWERAARVRRRLAEVEARVGGRRGDGQAGT
ncbi:heme exporter protein CcmD [Amaricoccus sp.]|uniref:heme exporter protein CcmD n=1 Tax=Amaricoccus sp. TaxID=1872485 RepID=UPI00260F5AFE|nr:heme exporter protein CcmD [Amaricoccus sp.]HRO11583.1 heme exporter protein CcmD [Amaricoccus sp.]